MTELDKALTVLELKLHDLTEEERSYQRRIDAIALERAAVEGEIKGIALARELFAAEVVAEDTGPQRRSVQKPVMALFGPENPTWAERIIAEQLNLPTEATHKFLLRAVQKGMLRRLPNGEYGLPIEPVQEAADAPRKPSMQSGPGWG